LAKPGARKRSWSSMTALLMGPWQVARQFESTEVQVVTQPNQRAAAPVFYRPVTRRIRTN
jgi:hypothetical protein